MTVASESLDFAGGVEPVVPPCGGMGTPVAELSPANEVPTLAFPGILGTGLPSGGVVELSMFPIQHRARKLTKRTPSCVPERPVGTGCGGSIYLYRPGNHAHSGISLGSMILPPDLPSRRMSFLEVHTAYFRPAARIAPESAKYRSKTRRSTPPGQSRVLDIINIMVELDHHAMLAVGVGGSSQRTG